MKKAIKILLATALTFSFFALVGCNTFEGLGRDIESLGQKIQGADE